MNSVIKELKVFIAEDGKEFLSENACKSYEEGVLAVKKNIRYYKVSYEPDLTEKGCFMLHKLVAVYSLRWYHSEIVENWCVNIKGMKILGEGVQGFGFMPHFHIASISEDQYFNSDCEKVFLSPKAIDGFPENYDYITKWGFK